MKSIAIIQARMGSTRLPGKVLLRLCGRSVLSHVIQRVKACLGDSRVVVATTEKAEDDAVVREAVTSGVKVFRGSEIDVLARYYLAAKEFDADTVIRVTSDCPLLDPDVLCGLLERYSDANGALDYLSNTLERTFPRGLDVEVFSLGALEVAYRNATMDYEREHVTPYLYEHPDRFRIGQYLGNRDLAHYRWTLDTPEDLALIEQIYSACWRENGLFTTDEVLRFLDSNPSLAEINAHVEQKKLES